MATYTIPLGRGAKYGTIEVDDSRFNAEVEEYLWLYGIRQVLNDAMATKKDKDGEDLSDADIRDKAEKRLQALYDGTLRQRGESSEPLDPIEAIAWGEVRKAITAQLKAEGEWKDIPKGTRNVMMFVLNRMGAREGISEREEEDVINAVLDSDPSFRRDAKRVVDSRGKREAGVLTSLLKKA
jgi:hypothetical protein